MARKKIQYSKCTHDVEDAARKNMNVLMGGRTCQNPKNQKIRGADLPG